MLALAFIFLYPLQTTVVPAWRLQVIDTNGNPVSGIGINYYWQHYGIEWNGSEERTDTDSNGYVSFPARTTRASLAQRALRAITNAPYIVHASWGRSGHIVVWGKPDVYETASVSYDGSYTGEGTPPSAQVVLRRVQPPSN